MIGRTLFRYIAGLFLRWILGLFAGIILLTFLIDLLEVLRSAASKPNFNLASVVAVSALRIPALSEQVLPFAVLLGSMASLVNLSRRSELVVSRSAGLSVWQFSAPGVIVALVIGIFATTVYNPMATAMKAQSDRIAAEAVGRVSSILGDASSSTWLRQHTEEGDSIVRVGGVLDGGRVILAPVFWNFDATGRLARRVEASSAELGDGRFTLTDARIWDVEGEPRTAERLEIPSALTPQQVSERLSSPTAVSFWRLPTVISQAANAGLPPYRFSLQYHSLIARPALLAAMVLIAATVSLGSSRMGNGGRMILGGIAAGFMLYVGTEIFRDLGSEGLVPPMLAAWAPAAIALSLGSTVLLFREDG
ncbi:LPS export ABC transporter permease LptG [Methylobrevis albus]|uniref:LPS export ABC transporter permease LptG n=1 Tax=Methylobrevis albus TaxID=2793297 RepID=A0A931I522_9HYPH|nr:LPS export ABC transporter permease LptG [Methylobrevis albus]MBH0239699.1 LPS export ABC transporter permease LptG [Methylobrevis albus]